MSEFKYNEEAWEKIFSDYHILEEINEKGFFKITSEEINKYRDMGIELSEEEILKILLAKIKKD